MQSNIEETTIQKIYEEIEKICEGDIDKLRTVLITLLVTTLVGLSDDDVEQHIMRVVNLADKNRKPVINPEIKNEIKKL